MASSSGRRGSASSVASSSSSASSSAAGLDLFQEPASFRPPTPPPTQACYDPPSIADDDDDDKAPQPSRITLNLVGSHPLWGHHLWNAAPTMSDYLIRNRRPLLLRTPSNDVKGKGRAANVLELGAAAGLPSIVSSRYGARRVVSTDWPDADLVGNLAGNLTLNDVVEPAAKALGFVWGADPKPLLDCLGDAKGQEQKFDVILLSDLVFNHMAHHSLLDSMEACIDVPSSSSSTSTSTPTPPPNHDYPTAKPDLTHPCALCFFTHHRPHLADKDMHFFDRAARRGWTCTKVGEWKMEPMFKDDPGPAEVRGTVHGWHMVWDGIVRPGIAEEERDREEALKAAATGKDSEESEA